MTEPDIIIRPFAPADLETLQEIRAAAFAPVFRSFREIVGGEIAAIAFARAETEMVRIEIAPALTAT